MGGSGLRHTLYEDGDDREYDEVSDEGSGLGSGSGSGSSPGVRLVSSAGREGTAEDEGLRHRGHAMGY